MNVNERRAEFLRRVGPHLAVTEVTWRHDIGDEIARRHGSPMVGAACGREVTSTVATRRADAVRCPDCLAVAGRDVLDQHTATKETP